MVQNLKGTAGYREEKSTSIPVPSHLLSIPGGNHYFHQKNFEKKKNKKKKMWLSQSVVCWSGFILA